MIERLRCDGHEIVDAALIRLGWIIPGERPSIMHESVAAFHLEGLRQEMPKATDSKLATEIAERLTMTAFDLRGNIRWAGDSIETMAPARHVLSANRYLLDSCTAEFTGRMLRFYSGEEQWERAVEDARYEKQRPSLVINQIPALVAAAVAAQRTAGLPDLTDQEMEQLIVVLTARNSDAQRLYNYLWSSVAEITAVNSERLRFRVPPADLPSDGASSA